MVKAKKWILAKVFDGEPKLSDFKLVEEELSETLKDGEIIVEAVYLSVDPYMRLLNTSVGSTLVGEQVAKVTHSKSSKFPMGTLIQLSCGWRSHTHIDTMNMPESFKLRTVPPMGDLSPSSALGIMGMPGLSAYFAFLEICKPKTGETVLVSAAAGAVGSVVGQIAKIKGCTVIGFAGTKEKCDWIKSLGFDCAFNYKQVKIDETLKQVAPNGIDCYFDNVGGEFTSIALQHMRPLGRVAIVGSISTYNQGINQEKVPNPFMGILFKQLTVKGFYFFGYPTDQFPTALAQINQWIKEGKIKHRETVKDEFDNMPQTFMSQLKGGNIGKMIVRA